MYIVVEIQKPKNGEYASIVTHHSTRAEAESKYYNVLSYAAASDLDVHGAYLFDIYNLIDHKVYDRQQYAGED
ncbi:MAG: hypothetical protein IIY75_02220 [Erysipelotrichales bacterium]|nr:hypothetical protein [Erysipelotrichales bacterium]